MRTALFYNFTFPFSTGKGGLAAGSGSKEESSVTKVKQHKKILDRGKPDDLMPGLKKSQEPLPGNSFDKFAGLLFHHVEKIRQMKELCLKFA